MDLPNLSGGSDWIGILTSRISIATIAVLLVLVITGIIPTPLMSAIALIPKIYSQHLEMQKPLDRLVHFNLIDCLRKATTPADRGDCYWEPPTTEMTNP